MKIVKSLSLRFNRLYYIAKSLLGAQYALMLEYRAEIALWALSGLLPLIMLSLWIGSDVTQKFGWDKQQLIRYFISAFIVRQFTAVWVMVSFEEDNIEGRLSPFLLQPIAPFWRYFCSHIAEQITRIPIVILMITFLFLINKDFMWIPSCVDSILAIVTIFLAFTCRFLLHWIFCMLCFFNDRASAIERLLLLPYLFLSGLVAPIDIYPTAIHKLAMLTPYPFLLSFPSKILSGNTTNILTGFLSLILWNILFLIISIYTWRRSVRHYSAMGA